MSDLADKYPHYHKRVPPGATTVDVYRLLTMFEVTDPCLQHALKKVLAAGKRGAKDPTQDVKEAIVTLQRYLEMRQEEVTEAAPVGQLQGTVYHESREQVEASANKRAAQLEENINRPPFKPDAVEAKFPAGVYETIGIVAGLAAKNYRPSYYTEYDFRPHTWVIAACLRAYDLGCQQGKAA